MIPQSPNFQIRSQNLQRRQVRQFAITALVVLPLVCWWAGASSLTVVMVAAICAGLIGLAWVAPDVVRPLLVGATLITMPIGMVVGELAMLLIYLGVFLPIGLAFRILGRDALKLRVDRQVKSHWIEKGEERPAASYYRRY